MNDAGKNSPSVGLSPADGAAGAAGGLRLILRKFLQSVDGMLPATVIAVDAKREYATVQPQVMMLGVDGKTYARAQIAKVPIFTSGAGNFVLSFPLKPKDMGWIIASDRDISLFLQKNAAAGPNTQRLHSFEDAVFFPDAARKWTLVEDNKDDAVWQSLDGSVRIALSEHTIKMKATNVDIDATNTTVTGVLRVTGNIVGQADVLANQAHPPGVSLVTHTHSGVTTGSGHTGPPDA